MKDKIKGYWQDSFWRHNIIFFSFSMVIAVINYLYYPVLGRIMDISHFGEVQTLLSIINIVGMILAAVQIVIINLSANQKSISKNGNGVINQFEQASILFVLILAFLISVGSVALRNFFSFDSFVPFIVLGVVLIVGVPSGFRNAYLQGKQKFGVISISGLISTVGKLLMSVVFVYAGFKTAGAIGGILVAQLVALVYSTRVASKIGFVGLDKSSLGFKKLAVLKPELKYLVSVMLVSLVLTLMISGDVLVVKRYFSPELAGQYAGISVIAKSIYFATASFSGVLLASVGQSYSREHNLRTGRKSLLLLSAIGISILTVFCIFPDQIIHIMLGERYVGQANLLPLLSLTVLLCSVANICMYYLLALRDRFAAGIAIISICAVSLLIFLRHGNLEAVVQDFLAGTVLLIIMIIGTGLYSFAKESKG